MNSPDETQRVLGDDDLDDKIKSIMSKHKLMKKKEQIEKELPRSNSLLSKYDTTRVLALRARSKLAEEREMEKEVKLAVGDDEEGDEKEFLERVAAVDFSENAIASPERISNMPRRRPKSASAIRKKAETYPSVSGNGTFWHDEGINNSTKKKIKKKKKKKKNSEYEELISEADFYGPPTLPPYKSAKSPPAKTPVNKSKKTSSTFNPDEWWNEQQKLNPNADYKFAIRRSQTEPVLKRPKSAPKMRQNCFDDEPMVSTKDLKSYLAESRNSKAKPPTARMYLREFRKKQEHKKEAVMAAILEEANNMESKVHVCLDEANSYAKYLGLQKRFSLYWRSSEMNNMSSKKPTQRSMNTYEMARAIQRASTQDLNNTCEALEGAGSRLEKMMVEVMEARGEATKVISVDNFFREHEQLQLDVRRKRNLMSTEQRAQEDKDEKNKAKEASSKRKGVVNKQNSLLDQLEQLKERESPKKTERPGTKERRKETEEKINKILENTANVTKILENQLRELQSRGWNQACI